MPPELASHAAGTPGDLVIGDGRAEDGVRTLIPGYLMDGDGAGVGAHRVVADNFQPESGFVGKTPRGVCPGSEHLTGWWRYRQLIIVTATADHGGVEKEPFAHMADLKAEVVG